MGGDLLKVITHASVRPPVLAQFHPLQGLGLLQAKINTRLKNINRNKRNTSVPFPNRLLSPAAGGGNEGGRGGRTNEALAPRWPVGARF